MKIVPNNLLQVETFVCLWSMSQHLLIPLLLELVLAKLHPQHQPYTSNATTLIPPTTWHRVYLNQLAAKHFAVGIMPLQNVVVELIITDSIRIG